MPWKYPPEQKTAALMILAANYGDLQLTSDQTGIPIRTLTDWKRDGIKQQKNNFHRKQLNMAENAENPEDNEFFRLREILMEHVFSLSMAISDEEDATTLSIRSLAISRLLDRIIKLDDFIPSTFKEKTVRFEYVYDGSVHNAPPWANPDYNPYNGQEDNGLIGGQVKKGSILTDLLPHDQPTDAAPTTLAESIFGPPDDSTTE